MSIQFNQDESKLKAKSTTSRRLSLIYCYPTSESPEICREIGHEYHKNSARR